MSENENIKLYQKLPEPYAITPAQIKASYQTLYDKISEALKINDFNRIYNIFYCSVNSSAILSLKIPQSDKSTFLADFVNLVYSIITIYPVKYYKTQLIATKFLSCFLKKYKTIPNLVLNWEPYYKVMKYYTFSSESFFISGEKIAHIKNEKNTNNMSNFFELSNRISQYFPDGIDSKTTTTEQLVKKFIPKISPNGQYTPCSIAYFAFLCPPHKGRYKLFIDFLLLQLRDTSNKASALIFYLINKILNCKNEFVSYWFSCSNLQFCYCQFTTVSLTVWWCIVNCTSLKSSNFIFDKLTIIYFTT